MTFSKLDLLQVAVIISSAILLCAFAVAKPEPGYYYELKIYHLKTSAQEQRMENYLKGAYLPALHRAGIKNVGVFRPVEKDSLPVIYVYIPVRTLQVFSTLNNTLKKDKQYQVDGKDYLDASYDNAPYQRIQTILLRAFEGMPFPAVPELKSPKEERVYELRSYEGPTEKYYANKVQMFNKGEVDLFKRLGFNTMFYSEVLAGSSMPNLMYMTCFDNKASRDDHWKAFSADSVWKRLSSMPEYQNNVSKNTITFLHPATYSDF